MPDDIQIIEINHPLYPPLLKQISDAPERLFVRGSLEILSAPRLLAVVGSRRARSYGKQCIERILPPAVEAGVIIVSGMAFGIDGFAHQVAVDAHKPTIAVLGTGIDDASLYPRAHRYLAADILEHGGALVSEYEPGTPAYPGNFPARNRIIAGLCTMTAVVQASIRSGSLITARLALESGRDVCAVPGAITDPLNEGTNILIQQGAHPLLTAADLLQLYNLVPEAAAPVDLELTLEQSRILTCLSPEPLHIDEIIQQSGLATETVSALITELELLGVITHNGGLNYTKP